MALSAQPQAAGVQAAASRQTGTVETVTLADNKLGLPKQIKVYLPAGYPGSGPYPTLYLFRGTVDEWLNPQQDSSRQGRTAVSVYEGLRQRNAVGPMILVFMGLGSDDGRWPGILTDWVAPQAARTVGTGAFASYFFDDVIPTVDRRFRTLATGRGRAVDGFSLGGWAAVQAAASHPEQFASVGAYDGTFPLAADRDHVKSDDGVIRQEFLDPVFGAPRQWSAVTAASPANRIWQAEANSLRQLTWLVEYGPEAAEPDDANYYRGDGLVKILKSKGIANRLGVRADGHHTWWTADEHLKTTLPVHWQAMQQGGR
jgi:S-formylglutathione hydrolase FrmB